jgi:hypothetical protein
MLPSLIRAEVKFTTRRTVAIPRRELESLQTGDRTQIGILAVLFLCGDKNTDGRWFISDVNELIKMASSKSLNIGLNDMLQAERSQTRLKDLRNEVKELWFQMVNAYLNEALTGHSSLKEELQRRYQEQSIADRMISDDILDVEHIDTINQIVNHHGPSVSGHIFQDLFAYLFSLLGYRSITINSVGVPDVIMTGLESDNSNIFIGPISQGEAQEIIKCIEKFGNKKLLRRVQEQFR